MADLLDTMPLSEYPDAATTAIAALHHDNTLLRQELARHRADIPAKS
jgi:hypothetical protein